MDNWTKEVPKLEGFYPVIYNGRPAIYELSIMRDDEAVPRGGCGWILSGMGGMMMEVGVSEIDYWGIRLPPRPKLSPPPNPS